MALLIASDITKTYGGLMALSSVDVRIERSEIVGIIGPNGAGKTTLFNVLCGLEPADRGKVLLDGEDITGHSIIKTARKGLVRTFQRSLPFASMSLLENLMVAKYAFSPDGWKNIHRRWLGIRNPESTVRESAMQLLELAGLSDKSSMLAGELPYGDQRRLEIARALMTEPKVLLLDEPAAGLSQNEADTVMELLDRLRTKGQTVVVIEHNLSIIMSLCDRVLVLDHGVKIAEGTPYEVQNNQKVIEAYIGTKKAHARSH